MVGMLQHATWQDSMLALTSKKSSPMVTTDDKWHRYLVHMAYGLLGHECSNITPNDPLLHCPGEQARSTIMKGGAVRNGNEEAL